MQATKADQHSDYTPAEARQIGAKAKGPSPCASGRQACRDAGHTGAVVLGGFDIAEGMASASASEGACTSRPTEVPRLLASLRAAASSLAGSRPRVTQMPPCCEARVCRPMRVTCLSPFRLALTEKRPTPGRRAKDDGVSRRQFLPGGNGRISTRPAEPGHATL